MIGSLRGVLLEVSTGPGDSAGEAILEVGGVGYRVVMPATVAAGVGLPGEAAFLFVHTHVKEDAIVLYGFTEREQLRCFEALVEAHGVGPALALAILCVHRPASLHAAVLDGDVDALVQVPGVGRKTAQRLLIELEARFGTENVRSAPRARPRPAVHAEVRDALSGLGYGPDEVREAIRALPDDGGVEELLRSALRELAAAR